jgi:N-acyl-L-homoserine lactone synthetase
MRFFVNDEREARGNWHVTGRTVLCGAADVAARRGRAVAVVADKPLPEARGVTSLLVRDGVELTRVEPRVAGSSACR